MRQRQRMLKLTAVLLVTALLLPAALDLDGPILANTVVRAASGANPDGEYKPKNNAKAEALKPLGVFVGTEKGFELERAATRIEAAVMLTRLLGKEEQARQENNPHTFLDVPEWGGFYVGYLYKNGLAAGISAAEFGSEGKCTAQMYVTFVLRALGYSDRDGADFTYSDALGFAVKTGLISAGQRDEWSAGEFLRDDLAGISYDALRQEIKGGGQTLSGKLFGEEMPDIAPAETEPDETAPGQQAADNPYLNMTYAELEELFWRDIYEVMDLGIYFRGAHDGYLKYKKHHPHLPFVDCVLRVNMGLTEPPFPKKGREIGPVKNSSLVNKYNRVSLEDSKLRPEEIETINGENFKLRSEARIAYEKMREAAANDGITLVITGAYRTTEEQEALYNEALKTKSQAGVDLEIARPRYSENEIGLAVELAVSEGSAEYNWLAAHAHEYGFILRYPKGKEELTQYNFNPGHYRYLGADLANKVKNSGLCYDEYFHKILRPGDISHYIPSNNKEENE